MIANLLGAQLERLRRKQMALSKGTMVEGWPDGLQGSPFPTLSIGQVAAFCVHVCSYDRIQQSSCCESESKASLCCYLISTRILELTRENVTLGTCLFPSLCHICVYIQYIAHICTQ